MNINIKEELNNYYNEDNKDLIIQKSEEYFNQIDKENLNKKLNEEVFEFYLNAIQNENKYEKLIEIVKLIYENENEISNKLFHVFIQLLLDFNKIEESLQKILKRIEFLQNNHSNYGYSNYMYNLNLLVQR